MTASQASTALSFKTILFATDFSPASESALHYAISLAHSYDSQVIVVHAVPVEPLAGVTIPPIPEVDLALQDGKRSLEQYVHGDVFAGLRHELLLERGAIIHVHLACAWRLSQSPRARVEVGNRRC